MRALSKPFIPAAAMAVLLAASTATQAVVIERTYVGTFSNALSSFGSDPANNPAMIARGGKYVVRTHFDTAAIQEISGFRVGIGRSTFGVNLGDDPQSNPGGNTYELFIPTQGWGVLSQDGQDHFPIGFGYAPTAELQFFGSCNSDASCDAAFRGFEFESNFIRSNSATTAQAGGDIIFEQSTADVSFGTTLVTNHVVNVLNESFSVIEGNGGHVDVLSESSSASGGKRNPGVFFAQAVDVVAEAGAAELVYAHDRLSVTTDAGTEQLSDTPAAVVAGQLRTGPSSIDDPMRQADNDLGAGRSDGEDYLTYEWNINGGVSEGDESGQRLNRTVETLNVADPASDDHGSHFAIDGMRSVDNVNKTAAIANSGLTKTTDVVEFVLQVSEDMTGKQDTDTVQVSYENSLPSILDFQAMAQGSNILFTLAVEDLDMAINSQLPDFELLEAVFSVDDITVSGLEALLSTGSLLMNKADLIATFGLGETQLDVFLSDRFLREENLFVSASTSFTVVPLPAPVLLLLSALGAVVFTARRRTDQVTENQHV